MGKAKRKEWRILIPPEATRQMKAFDQVAIQAQETIARAQTNQKLFINGFLAAKGIQPKRWELSDDRTTVIIREVSK